MNLVEREREGRDHDTRVAAPDGRGFVLAPVRVRDADSNNAEKGGREMPMRPARPLGQPPSGWASGWKEAAASNGRHGGAWVERASAPGHEESRPRRQRNRLGREMLMHSNGLEPSP